MYQSAIGEDTMKKIIAMMAVLMLLLSLLPASASIYDPESAGMLIETENGKSVNMREEPNSDSKMLTIIPAGKIVLVYSDFISNQWSHVQYGMLNGFVMSKFLTDRMHMYIKSANGKSVNMREEPNANSKVVTSLPYGNAVIVFSDFVDDQWLHVQYGMYSGYMMSKFLTVKEPEPLVSPTPKPTLKPAPTPTLRPTARPTDPPTPEQRRANEILEAQKLGIVPQGMKTDGIATWDDLNNLLTNVVRLKTMERGKIPRKKCAFLVSMNLCNTAAFMKKCGKSLFQAVFGHKTRTLMLIASVSKLAFLYG